jgi:hypothetical protein
MRDSRQAIARATPEFQHLQTEERMKSALIVITIVALTCAGCSDASKAKADAEAARVAQARAEAELVRVKAEAEHANSQSRKVESPAKTELVAPQPLSPADGSEFSNFPRKTTIKWSPVAGAASYKVEIEYQDPATKEWQPHVGPKETGPTEREFDFVGGQPGRWRVWAVDAEGHEGPKSGWWTFRYTQ